MDTWGLIPKGQTDPETIEEAIARMIADHEADPTAHLGENEAIEVHRKNEILDHVKGSVLADKWTMNEIEFTTNFENLSAFSLDGTTTLGFPGVQILPDGTGDANKGMVAINFETGALIVSYGYDFLFQWTMCCNNNSGTKNIVGYAVGHGAFNKYGFGIEITNTVKRFYCSKNYGADFNYLNFPDFTADQTYVYRMQYIASESVIECYIDGSLIGTLAVETLDELDMGSFIFAISKTIAGGQRLYPKNFFCSLTPEGLMI